MRTLTCLIAMCVVVVAASCNTSSTSDDAGSKNDESATPVTAKKSVAKTTPTTSWDAAITKTIGESEEPTKSDKRAKPAPEASKEDEEAPSIEYALASINAGQKVDNDDETIDEFARLLTSIESKTKYTKQEIADITVFAQKDLKENGINMGLLELMRDFDKGVPANADELNLDFKELVALYLTVAESNQ